MNLIEGLMKELQRNRGILKLYEEIPAGGFGATLIRKSIQEAEQAISEGDTVAMLRAYEELKTTK